LDEYKSPHSREIKKLITQGLDDKGSVTIAMVPEKGQSLSEALATLREELGHTWQKRFEVEAGKHLPEIEFKKLNDAIPAAMSYYLKKNDYKDDDGSEIANKYRVLESAAKMIADKPKALGLSEDEWANYLFQYFELVEKTHGKDALDQLKHITTPARHVKEDYYNAKGNGSGSETDRGVLGGVQGGREGSPEGTGSETEPNGGASSADRRVNGGLQEEKGIDEINRRMRSGLGREAPNGTAEEGRSGNTKDILRGGEISKGDSEHKTDGDIRGVVSSAPGDDAKREGDSRGGAGITRAAEEGDSESGSLEDRIAPSETGTKYKFGSTQANLPEGSPAHGAILAMQEKIPDSDLAGDGKDVDQPHVTVRYGLKTDLTPELRKFIESQSPFEAKLGPTTAFPPSKSSDGAAPIVAPVISPELHRINAEIEKQGEFEPSSFPEYRPHVSVAYVKPELAKKYTGMKDAEGKTFPITSIAVTDKNGDHTEIPLKGESPSAAGQESSLESNTSEIGDGGNSPEQPEGRADAPPAESTPVPVQGGTVIVGGPQQVPVVPVELLVQQHFIAYKNGSTMGTGFSSRSEAEKELAETFPNRDDMEVRSGDVEEKPKSGVYYRGTNPDETKRISTGDPVWDSYLFAADQVKQAKGYGRSIEKIQIKPTAKVLVEGSSDFKKLVGDYKPGENMLSYSSRAAKLAKAAGYDLVHFKRQGDVGTAIINREAIESRKPYTNVRELMLEAGKRNPTKMIP
jgi:2'-5' RNA ligase